MRWLAHTDAAASACLLGMLGLSLAHGLVPAVSPVPAGLLGLAATALLMGRLSRRLRMQVITLAALGLAGMGLAALQGRRPNWPLAVSGSQALIAMLVAVSFLGLVTQLAREGVALPRGRLAFWRTLAGVHIFGGVANVSAIYVVGDRLIRSQDRTQLLTVSRGYAAAAFWSPFWGAMAVALVYAPGADLAVVIGIGALLAVAALAIAGYDLFRHEGASMASYEGYPWDFRSLWLPVVLTIGVLAVRWQHPTLSVITIISLLAPAVTVAALVIRARGGTLAALRRHAATRLPQMHGELAIFTSAAVLTAGVTDVLAVEASWLPFERFGGTEAVVMLVASISLAWLGLHPIIPIGTLGILLAPLSPDPTLFAMTALFAWGIGAMSGPLSGINVTIQGRFGIDSFRLARWNLGYALVLMALAGGVLFAVAAVRGL